MEINYPGGSAKIPSFNIDPWVKPAVMVLLVVAMIGTSFYQVDKDESGVVQRFGKYVRKTGPGLHFKMPLGIETVKKIKTTFVYKQEFGYRTITRGGRTIVVGRDSSGEQSKYARRSGRAGNPYLAESLMLTGDLNVAVVEWIVQYTVKDPVAFAFRIKNPHETLHDMSEAVMRLVIGDHTINQILTTGREKIQHEAKEKLQILLDSYGSGISVRNVILQNVTPPKEVEPSFNEVNEARQEKEKLINQAWQEYNRVIPKAKGQAEQVIRNAEGYALERVNKAKGDADRFLLAWEAYKTAPEVTKKRLYLETMQEIWPNLGDKILIDEEQKGIVPLLNLNKSAEKGGNL